MASDAPVGAGLAREDGGSGSIDVTDAPPRRLMSYPLFLTSRGSASSMEVVPRHRDGALPNPAQPGIWRRTISVQYFCAAFKVK